MLPDFNDFPDSKNSFKLLAILGSIGYKQIGLNS